MHFLPFILALVGPVVVRAVIALGFTAVTFTGVVVLVDNLIIYAQGAWGSLPGAVLQLASLSGIPEFLGLVFGAVVSRVAMFAAVSATRYVLKG